MALPRAYGVLLHPTSLAGPWGIGVLGKEARRFIDWLWRAQACYWQVLPLGATGFGDCPYLGVSAWAGNPYLIDPDDLCSRGWLPRESPPDFPQDRVDFEALFDWKWMQLRRAHQGFLRQARPKERRALEEFCQHEAFWLPDYCLFMTLTEKMDRIPWNHWPEALRRRIPAALEEARSEQADDIAFHEWTQWVFFQEWEELRRHAAGCGIRIIGDVPIFVAFNSAEVWAHQEYFFLDDNGHPTVVGGVPPDYFSQTGQRWGNPLYRWERLEQDNFQWWIERVKTVLRTCDLIRIDHFRGFEAYWEIPAAEPTAIGGRWVKGPGPKFFATLKAALGDTPIIAEDLGLITDEVRALRDQFGFPGMKVLQFAFDGDGDNGFLPHNFPPSGNCLVYTGTHDNDTALGWYRGATETERQAFAAALARQNIRVRSEQEVPWAMIKLALQSSAMLAMIPLQDVLGLGSEARMNQPALSEGNWAWRYRADSLVPKLATRLRRLAIEAGRAPRETP